ncbi:uncharacterized protein LOC143547487 [Bidens hawaiensis]|uniref:uncharacterized protein LOC143547487 n=1 Tax=Bidens hawaiensis TaxID=980011 RepID=UPI00404B5330
MNPYAASHDCHNLYSNLSSSSDACSYLYSHLPSLEYVCANLSILAVEIERCKDSSEMEGKYSAPMVLIGIYISIASLFCILAMALDLLNGFRNRKFWFPTKLFSLNAASITVITVAMKLPVDLTSPMLGAMDQVAKVGSLAFMCTMMANLMPSLASMDNKALIANVTDLKYQAISKRTLNDQFPEETLISTVDKLSQLVKGYWIMTETSSPQFVMSMKAMLCTLSTGDDTDEDLSIYVLLLEDHMQLAEKTMKGISNSMNCLIQKAEKKQHSNLLKLLEKSVAFDGVEMFDADQIQSPLPLKLDNSWSLPIISLTCIAIVIPNIHKDKIDALFKSAFEYVNIRRATATLWHEVEFNRKWLGNSLKRSGYEGKTPKEIISLFSQKAKEIVNEFSTSTKGEQLDKENLPLKLIAANSMHRIAQTIMHTYKSNNLEIVEDELFTRLSTMIADILAACFTNLPRVITMKCDESAIEKREASVVAEVDLFGRTIEIMKRVETRELPIMNRDKMGFIDEWRSHLKQP